MELTVIMFFRYVWQRSTGEESWSKCQVWDYREARSSLQQLCQWSDWSIVLDSSWVSTNLNRSFLMNFITLPYWNFSNVEGIWAILCWLCFFFCFQHWVVTPKHYDDKQYVCESDTSQFSIMEDPTTTHSEERQHHLPVPEGGGPGVPEAIQHMNNLVVKCQSVHQLPLYLGE